jgi:transcriptional regulator with XRE-family HTH domain
MPTDHATRPPFIEDVIALPAPAAAPRGQRWREEDFAAMTLGQMLRALRLAYGAERETAAPQASTREIARMTTGSAGEISHAWLSHLERDMVERPNPRHLITLSQLFEIPPEWLLRKAGVDPGALGAQDANPLAESRLLHPALRAALVFADQKLGPKRAEKVQQRLAALLLTLLEDDEAE